MAFRVTIQVTCDTIQDAQDALARLGRTHPTWDEQVDKSANKGAMAPAHAATTARIDKIMGTPPERENVSPGEPSIGKIGKENADTLIALVMNKQQPADKWEEHMKLLWKRGLVKFDGEYYL